MPNKLFSLGAFLDLTTYNEIELRDRIRFVKTLKNLEHVEIWWELENAPENFVNIIQKELAGLQIIIHAPFINLSLVGHEDINNASIHVLQKVYNIGLDLGARVFTVHAGSRPFFQSDEDTNALLISSLKKLKTKDSLICTLENMPNGNKATSISLLTKTNEVSQIIKQLPNFGITLDIGHVIQNKEENWQEWFIQNKEKIYNIHLHGAMLGGKAHFSLAKGDLDLKNFFKLLQSEGYGNFVTQEVVGREEIASSWEYVQAIINA